MRSVALGLAMPVEIRVDDHAFRHEGRAVPLVETEIVVRMPDRVAEQRGIPGQLAVMGARIGIEQELVRVETVAGLGLVGAVHAVAVDLPWSDIRQITVEDLIGVFGQGDALQLRPPVPSNRQTSTLVAFAENRAKLVPLPSQVAPRGRGSPSRRRFFTMSATGFSSGKVCRDKAAVASNGSSPPDVHFDQTLAQP